MPSDDPTSITGSLHSGIVANGSLPHSLEPSRTQPAPLWKALAYFFKNYLAPGGTNLSEDQQAIFITGIDQFAVPGGLIVPPHVRNYQLFAKADAVQTKGRLWYGVEKPSYFERLSMYLRYVVQGNGQEDDNKLNVARLGLLQAKVLKDKAWEAARAKYITPKQTITSGDAPNSALPKDDQGPLFESAFASYLLQDKTYNDAWQVELNWEKQYTELLGPQMQAIASRLDTIKFADDRLQENVGNNMVCTALSEDLLRVRNSAITSKDLYYRPLYSLPNYDALVSAWITKVANPTDDKFIQPGTYSIPLKNISRMTWLALGHPELDDAMPPQQGSSDQALLEAARVTISFIVQPKAIDIQRGLWNVPTPREYGKLAANAPEYVSKPFCKTIKMLVGWNFEIKIQLPPMIGTLSAKDVDVSTLGIQAEPNDDCTEWRWQTDRLAYPILLAVLAVLADVV